MKKEWTEEQIAFVEKLHKEGLGRHSITKEYNAKFKAKRTPDSIRHALSSHVNIEEVIRETAWVKAPKILLFDIETSPLEVYTFGLFDQNIGLNQIIKDWSVLSFSAKWAGSSEVASSGEGTLLTTPVTDEDDGEIDLDKIDLN